MLNKISPLVLIFILFFSSLLPAQNRFRGWEVFTSFKNVQSLDFGGNKVWAASTGGMFNFDINNPASLTKFTNLDGLRSVELNSILVDNTGLVWSGALDGSINIFNPANSSWRYITDIQASNETDKKISHMFQYGSYLFVSASFGIMKVDAVRYQLADQPYRYLGSFPVPALVKKTVVHNDTIWAATGYGIAYADVRNYLPIQSNWSNYNHNNSVLRSDIINAAVYFNGKVYFGTDNDTAMVCYANNTLSTYLPFYNGSPLRGPVIDLAVSGSSMYIATYQTSSNIYRVDASNVNEAFLVASGIPVNSLKAASNGDLYIGTSTSGVVKNNINNKILPNGPNSNLFQYVDVDANGNVWGTSGASGEGVYIYDGTKWKIYTPELFPQMLGGNFHQLYASSATGFLWASGFGEGLLRIKGDDVFLYNESNSCLQHYGSNPDFVLIEGVKEDHNGKLWVLNRSPVDERSIVNFTDCVRYSFPASPSHILRYLAIDNYNTKWMTAHENGDRGISLCYFNESAYSTREILATDLGTDINTTNDVTVDKNGEVWIATNNGIAIVLDPYEVIQNPNSSPHFFKMRIIANGLSTPLTEYCQTVRADALNNKWIATSSGLLYVSPDGSTILAQYNTTNSPLPENKVGSIALGNKSGKIYFGTSKGLVSFQTLAAEPLADCQKITAGPNPFVIPNDNLLRIDGLVEGSTVKILTISGTLVAEFESPGGRLANWDGKDLNGNLVGSGIYIIAGFNKDASKVCTGKVAVIRR